MMNLHAIFRDENRDYAVNLIYKVCALAGPLSIVDDARQALRDCGVPACIKDHDSGVLFDWLVNVLSFQ